MAKKINDSIFKQYLGTLDEFKRYYNEVLDDESRGKLKECLVFIHDKPISVDEDGNNVWNNDGYIFTNGYYYTCRETNLTASTILQLIEQGNTSGMLVEEVNGKLVFTPVIKEELKPLINVGFVKAGKTSWAAGTPIEEILNDIFAKEVWYKADFKYTDNLEVTMAAPTLEITVDEVEASDGVTYEMGAPISISASMNTSSATGDKFTVKCSTADNNGFVTNGNTSDRLTSLDMPATLSDSGSDSLTASGNGCFTGITANNNAISKDNLRITHNSNTLTVTSTSKQYTLTAAPSEDMETLTTLSNKGNYSDAETQMNDDVEVVVKHDAKTTPHTVTEGKTPQTSITLKGGYKYYWVWGVEQYPTIPASFCGDLTGWNSTWGSKTVNGNTVGTSSKYTTTNGFIYILKPSSDADVSLTAPGDVKLDSASFETISTLTNKYGTSYTLLQFPKTTSGAIVNSGYKDLVL